MKWSDLVSSNPYIVHGNTAGHVYMDSSESNLGAAWDGYRIEPVMSLGNARSLLLEIWFALDVVGNYSLYVKHRSGDTIAECESAVWTDLNNVSCNTPQNAVCYLSENARYHQIKWGTGGASEPFSVNAIEFKFVPQGMY
jgi:hypothetical protein